MRFKYFATAIAAITLAGCSNNDDVPAGNNQPDANKAQAYLKVKINQTGGSGVSRGSVPTDNEFEQATADEYNISSAKFYFYDANGNYVTDGNLTKQEIGGSEEKTDTKLDFKSNAVVVLKNTGKGYPKYMVTVLNAPESFNAEKKSLTELEKMLALAADGKVWTEKDNKCENFIMSTSSYLESGSRTVANKTYFVTEIEDRNYQSSESDAQNTANAVQVYVERLAAKVSFNISDEKFTKENTKEVDNESNKRTIYKLETVTVAEDKKEEDTGTNNISKQLYADILGWGLTNTAKNSYMMMNLGEKWTATVPFTGWQPSTTEYRSYWGMSTLYNETTINDKNLNRSSWLDADTPINSNTNYNYCAEHTYKTLTKDNLPKDATSVLIKAQLVDEDGQPVEYIRYNGLLWTYERFVENMCQTAGVYKKVGDEYTVLSPKDEAVCKFEHLGQGAIKLVISLNNSTTENEITLYDKNGTEITAESLTLINSTLESLVTPQEGSSNTKAIAYENGMMYYTIPIEHLYNDNDKDKIVEGEYGVVRNHYYKLTLTALSKIGHGVYKENEVIIPEPDPDYYYVGAQINVLSWHVVEQDVEL